MNNSATSQNVDEPLVGGSLDALVRCARANMATGVPSFIVLSFLLVALHNQGTHAAEERLICGAIGLIIGWLAGLWACCFYLRYGRGSADNNGGEPLP